MAKKSKETVVEIIPSTDLINSTFRTIVATESYRLKKLSDGAGLQSEDFNNLKQLANAYKTVESENREQQKVDSLHRLTQEELLELAFKVINGLAEKDKKEFILALVKENQKLLT